MNFEKITIEAAVNASPQKVWDYYTQPKYITQWNFADPSWCCPSAENDLRVGGKYSARMEAKDGSFGFDFEALYDELEPPYKMVYSLTDGRKVDITFKDTESGTQIIIVFDAETENPIEMQKDGWQAILNNFKDYVEKT
ncbi:SRPBCC family protein [Owenweeksia hongkongensis]|uniref:SRPBCC family protein n=1 Tax=Owenweeksia hongkongensis TaxID=253245 RepID=UPI003A8EFA51